MKNINFSVMKKQAFSIDNVLFQDLYSPIIGKTASYIYSSLYNEANRAITFSKNITELSDFLKQINISLPEFSRGRTFLEAMDLLESFYEVNEKTNVTTYSFILKQPLSFHEFVSNPKYKHLLIMKIGQQNYEKHDFFYGSATVSSKSINVTATFDSVFKDEELNKISNFNFDDLYTDLAKYTKMPICIGDESKTIIEDNFKTYNFSLNEIKKMVGDSIVLSDDHVYKVDPVLLKSKFNDMINKNKGIDVLKNIKLNRNIKMFLNYLRPEELKDIYNDYLCINSEQYLRVIYKNQISNEWLNMIKKLREIYCLSDGIINLVLDFTVFRLNGNINETYIYKIAKTINALNYNTIQQVYDHFMYKNVSSVNKYKRVKNENDFKWGE